MYDIVITGADRGLGYALCEVFVEKGWRVFAGQFMADWPQLGELKAKWGDMLHIISLDVSSDASVKAAGEYVASVTDKVDMLINNAGVGGRGEGSLFNDEPFDSRSPLLPYNTNALGMMRVTEALFPLLEKGEKRLCFVSSEAGSIAPGHRKEGFGYTMSKTSINMGVRLVFNALRPKGFKIRLYNPGWMRSYMGGKKSTVGKLEPEESAQVAYKQFTEDRAWEDALVLLDNNDQQWSI